MTETLAEKTRTPCRGGISPLTHEEAERFRAQASDWELRDNAHRIERTFRFRNFREAGAFVHEIGELAEAEGHHPDDFIMATKIDQIFDRLTKSQNL